jgi:hypothetical protein
MKAKEVVRFLCGDCQVVFELSVDPEREVDGVPIPPDADYQLALCPFCGASVGELKALHDQPIRVAPGP